MTDNNLFNGKGIIMRYQIGQVIYGINFATEGVGNLRNAMFVTPGDYFNSTVVKQIRFSKLTVTEHHRVPEHWEEDETKLTCDGYLLKDENGAVFANQYPRASYGQMTDTADRRFNLYFNKDEGETKSVMDKIDSGEILVYEFNSLEGWLKDVLESIDTNTILVANIAADPTLIDKYIPSVEIEAVIKERQSLVDRVYQEFRRTYPDVDYKTEKKALFKNSDIMHWEVEFKKI